MLSPMPSAPAASPENEPDVSHLVTEDDTPVDNIYSEKEQRILTDSLYSSWSGPPATAGEPRSFVAMANVGIFRTPKEPPLVPDMLLSLDVTIPQDVRRKGKRCYFVWLYRKMPEVVIEVVSNLEGEELGGKFRRYAQWGIPHYVVWDPEGLLRGPRLYVFELRGSMYAPMKRAWFESVGLGLTPWVGTFEGLKDRWLRWCRADGSLVLTGAELAAEERARAERERRNAAQERRNAAQERRTAEQERQKAERLAARLRALGIDPEDL
jgi:hypothetical protein